MTARNNKSKKAVSILKSELTVGPPIPATRRTMTEEERKARRRQRDCSPERRAKTRARHQKPEYKAKRKWYRQSPKNRERLGKSSVYSPKPQTQCDHSNWQVGLDGWPVDERHPANVNDVERWY
jgi:hypothetical protein